MTDPADILFPPVDVGAYLREASERVKVAAERDWPSTEHPENIWARDRSVRQFSAEVGADRITLTNEAPYSGYTDGGFTFRGPRTANPWAQRGATPYLEQTAETVVEAEAGALLASLTGGPRV